jgi:serine/threonine-protein kinase
VILFGSFYVVDVIGEVTEQGTRGLLRPALALHLALVLVLCAAWALVRWGERSMAVLGFVETAVTFAICATAVGLLVASPAPAVKAGPAFAVALTIVARSAIVPSRGLRTLFVGLVASLMVTAGYALSAPGTEPEPAFAFLWTFAFTVSSAVVSRVIYGLQQQVLEAQQLGQYVLEGKLGEGGMGIVYRAHHAMLRRDTAVKLLHPERTGTESLARFEREVRLTARLSHPNTITIFDYGRTPEGTFYYAMELLDGAGLDDVLAVAGPLPAERVVHVLGCVAGALAEAHDIGLIHRDIKPANIILCRQGGVFDVPKVVDFGLVKELDAAKDGLETKENAILGTPLYMSPEAIKTPGAVDGRSDLYALGAVGYYLLTGKHVFEGSTVVEVCSKHLGEDPVPPSVRLGVPVPAGVERVVLDCLAKDPVLRPQTASELQQRLRDTALPLWDAQSAQQWWSTHGNAVRSRHTAGEPVTGSARTLAIDYDARS